MNRMERSEHGLLGPGDPDPFEVVNPNGRRPLLLVCDHAGRAIPRALAGLGVSARVLDRHVAWDIGAADLTRALARRLDSPAVLQRYSRLVIDCNRQPGDPTAFPAVSDAAPIPGNEGLDETDQHRRVEAVFRPYHQAIDDMVARLWRRGPPPALFSVHTFTPVMETGPERPWDVGLLWNRDPRLAVPLINALRRDPGLRVGDNQPYSGREIAYTMDRHAGSAGLPHCAIEIRQDQVADPEGAARWLDRLATALEEVLAVEGLHQVEHF